MKQKKERLREFYIYVTGHGFPSEFIMHVGYQDAGLPKGDYPCWYSEPINPELANSIFEKVRWQDHTPWNWKKEESLRKLINKYIKEAKKNETK